MPGSAITLKQLRALLAVGQHGSITMAAAQVHLTPPAVHTQLKNLENILGVEILDRSTPGGMKLTEGGRVLSDAASRIEAELDNAMREIAAVKSGRIGHIRLGVVSTGKYFAPFLVARLRQLEPGIDIHLEVGNREHIISALRRRDLQLAIMGRPPREPEFVSETIGPHPHILIAPPGHPWAGNGVIPPEELIEETFIAREDGSGTRILTARYLDRIGNGKLYKSMVMGSNETIKQAVIAGLGIAIISAHTVIEELKSGRLVQLEADGIPLLRSWFLLYPTDTLLSTGAKRIHQLIADMKGDFLPALQPSA